MLTAEAKNITVSVGGRAAHRPDAEGGRRRRPRSKCSDVALQIETETSQRGQTITGYQTRGAAAGEPQLLRPGGLVTGSRARRRRRPTTTAVTSLVRAGSYNVNGQRSMFNNYPARRHGQQRVRREQPGLRQPDHPAPAGFHRAVPGGDQQRERRVRPLLRRHHQRGHARAATTNSTPRSTSSFATPI